MADFDRLINVMDSIKDGIAGSIIDCLDTNKDTVTMAVTEQLYSGIDGNGEFLSPTYDDDPYFSQPGPWQGRSYAYKIWKQKITPPVRSINLFLNPRPVNVPNLFITGTFHESIQARKDGDVLSVYTGGFRDGPAIEQKYGKQIFALTDRAKEYFNLYHLRPWLNDFITNCGYV